MYRIALPPKQRQELNERTHQKEMPPHTRDRLEMIRLSGAGGSIPRIPRHLGQHEKTVRRGVKVFLREGFEGLSDQPHPGKLSVLTP